MKRWHLQVNGVVQGVGFRPFIYRTANQLGLSGWVQNTSTGVEIEVQGEATQFGRFLSTLHHHAPPLAKVESVSYLPIPPLPHPKPGVLIRESNGNTAETHTLISPDVATCPDCLQELFDVGDHHHHYPFINCTHCGPRFTIITDLPYDRPCTTMAGFPLCPTCHAEYNNPADRRFHAQPVACGECGPQINLTGLEGVNDTRDTLDSLVSYLQSGKIVAVKGLGGFHLVCLAGDKTAVHRLRQAKKRPFQALALMVQNVTMARQLCHVNQVEADLLQSPQAPIVLLRKQANPSGFENLADLVAPQNGYLGVMLPYTPLYHLLLALINVPLVITSGNLPGEPLCIDNEETQVKLADLCEGFLLHNRPIARRCDDSVIAAADLAGETAVQFIRRSRGYTPLPVHLPQRLSVPLVATGADLKNVSAVATGDQVFLTQHIGNLDSPAVRAEQGRTISDFVQLFHIQPQAIVCDLHPAYASSRYARERARAEGLELIEVQHHHAHVAGCLAENGRTGPAMGLAFDGTGYGTDGRIWGGELLLADLCHFERLCHLEYLPLPGGDAATKRPYRIAIAYLRTLLPGVNVNDLFPYIPTSEISNLDRLLAQGVNTYYTSSMGRLFDAVSALLGLCHESSYEAQAAIALEAAALQTIGQPLTADHRYEFSLDGEQIRLAPLLDGILQDKRQNIPIPEIALRFHHTIAHMALLMVQTADTSRSAFNIQHSALPVALSGGVWQNRLLLEITVPLLKAAGFEVLLHRQVPANDGGLAYGQTAVAAAHLGGYKHGVAKGESYAKSH